jgi:putative tricarboxylic transport membrane protein
MLRRTILATTLAITMAGTALAEPAKVLVPAGAGGGYDTTTRLTMTMLEKQGLFKDGAVFTNRPGAGGILGLGEFIRTSKGNDNALMGMGVILLGAIVVTKGAPQITETTPIARLTFEYNGLAVPANSPIKTVKDLTDAMRANPGAVPFGGGSAGGVDHIIAGLLAKAAGIEAARVNYIPYASGGEALTQLAGGKLVVAIQGASELKALSDAGRVRVIAVTSPERLPGIDVPTLREQGVDVAMGNWRGMVGPPGMSAAAQKIWVDRLEKLAATPEWKAELAKTGLESAFLGGTAFGAFMESENARIKPILTDMGLVK